MKSSAVLDMGEIERFIFNFIQSNPGSMKWDIKKACEKENISERKAIQCVNYLYETEQIRYEDGKYYIMDD